MVIFLTDINKIKFLINYIPYAGMRAKRDFVLDQVIIQDV